METEGFKVVAIFMGMRRSAFYLSPASVTYIPGDFAKRGKGCGPLAAFKTLSAARRLVQKNVPYPLALEIWACTCVVSRLHYLYDATTCTRILGKEVRHVSMSRNVPRGTIFADQIRLDKPIESFPGNIELIVKE